jgi:hypothetical protein
MLENSVKYMIKIFKEKRLPMMQLWRVKNWNQDPLSLKVQEKKS